MSAQSEPQPLTETKKRLNYKKLYQSPDYFFDVDTSISPFGKRAGLDAFNSVGLFTYLRTYARRLDQDNAKSLVESWEQCIKRVVLATNEQLHAGFKHEELKELFDILYNLKCSVAGRFLWQLGTKTVEQSGLTSLQNCFRRDTKFWTFSGERRFSDFKSGSTVKVMTSRGWKEATVKSYEEQDLYRLFLHRGNEKCYIDCTANHRWIIQGSNVVKTSAELEKDNLLRSVNCALWTPAYGWSVDDLKPLNIKEEVWCVEVPELEEFVLGNGILTKNCAATVVDEPVEPFTWSMNMQMLGCVPPLSMVATETGLKMIKDVLKGEKVWSFDTTTGTNILKEVLETHDVIVEKTENIRLTCHYGNITVSKEHPILVFRDGKWIFIPSGQVKLGDTLNRLNEEDMYDTVIDIEDNLDIDEHWKDLTIEDTNNYFTGDGSQYCSHNCGVGYRITPEDVEKLPVVKYAEITRLDTKDADYIVPDTREGWVKLLGKVLKAHFYSGKGFSYSCALLRSKGAPIKGFGGVASGPDILCEGMVKISELLNSKEGQKLKPIDALDIMNIIGMIVVSGNVRRSAQIALGDFKDVEYLRAKRWDLGNIPNSRCYSNNSIICNDINEILDNEEFWDGYQGKGEPYGLINMKLTQSCGRTGETQYPDKDVVCYNPCSEQSLNNGEVCCLAEIYLPNITSREELFKCSKYLYRICKHSLTLPCKDSEKTEEVVHKNMRMGIGITGFCQSTDEQKSWLPECYEFLRNYDVSYSQRHKLPTSIKLTTCKPSGTLSLLAGVTSGVHPGYAKYYIRRIRLSSDSPLVDLARRHGYFVEYVRNFDGTMDRTTMVIEFPYELPGHTILAKNCNAIEQLENMKWVQKNWSDNSVSITVYYQRDELPAIKEWLRENYNDSVKTVSFLLHSEHGFDQAPLEEITQEKYEEMVRNTRPIDSVEGVCYHKEKDENLTDKTLCAGGVCPIR
jgi:ribonucleoside-triphosphate reductase (thioredoxin)